MKEATYFIGLFEEFEKNTKMCEQNQLNLL